MPCTGLLIIHTPLISARSFPAWSLGLKPKPMISLPSMGTICWSQSDLWLLLYMGWQSRWDAALPPATLLPWVFISLEPCTERSLAQKRDLQLSLSLAECPSHHIPIWKHDSPTCSPVHWHWQSWCATLGLLQKVEICSTLWSCSCIRSQQVWLSGL